MENRKRVFSYFIYFVVSFWKRKKRWRVWQKLFAKFRYAPRVTKTSEDSDKITKYESSLHDVAEILDVSNSSMQNHPKAFGYSMFRHQTNKFVWLNELLHVQFTFEMWGKRSFLETRNNKRWKMDRGCGNSEQMKRSWSKRDASKAVLASKEGYVVNLDWSDIVFFRTVSKERNDRHNWMN